MNELVRRRFPSILFYALCTFMLVVSVVSFINAYSLINKPFPGFFIYKFPRVASLGSRNWPGPQAGLRFMERIASADGQPITEGPDVVAMARQKPLGTPIEYAVESAGEIRTVVVPTAKFTLKDFFSVFFSTFACGFIIFCLGCIGYVLKPNVSSSWVFLFICFFLGTYMVTGVEMQSTYAFVHLNYFTIPLISAGLFHLCLIFPDRKNFMVRHPILEYLIYIPALLLVAGALIYLFSFGNEHVAPWVPGIRTVSTLNRLFWLACVVGFVILLIHSLCRASSTVSRQRARMILFGLTIAFSPTVLALLITSLMKFNFPWNIMVFFVAFFPASIAYSIVKHNLFDADALIQRTVGYVVVTGVVVGAYIGVSLVFNVFVGKYQVAQSRAFPILFTLGIILIFNPLRNRIQALVDRIFFRKEYDYGAIVEKVGGAMTSLLDLAQILKRLTQTFIEDMFINTSSIMLLTAAGTEYQVYLADGEGKQDVEKAVFKSDEPLMEIMEEKKKELTKYDVLEDPKYKSVSESCAANFETLNASLMVPLVFQDQVIGILNLGDKKSGKFYNREDIDLLRTVANQGAVAIENARLFQENLEKQRMKEELSIARDLQMSMLPATCPEIKGYQIAASSTPAREVGGDFYDFIEMEDDKVGLVVADVTGKSVSGALVMSSSRSVFRMLSEERLNVGDIMTRANRRIKQDIKSGMFVALLYAVLDPRKGKVRLCSAGQTQPIHLSARDGAAKLVETKGDSFPLGILDEADYRETEVWLPPGDSIVFYTDGIVEAMNEQEEIFGFERLLEIVQSGSSMTAEELHREILDKVSVFAGTAAQHDDLTVIVVKAESGVK